MLKHAWLLALIALLLATACSRDAADSAEPYTIISDDPYNESVPANTAWGPIEEMRCLKVTLVAANGSNATGSMQLTHRLGGSGASSDYFDCFPEGELKVLLSMPGHTPKEFLMNVSPGRMLHIQVPMARSCSEQSYDTENEGLFFERLAQIGLNSSEYTLTCMEYRPGRSSLMKGKGVTAEGAEFAFSFRTGWCSSGGADCGGSTCFSTTDERLFSAVVSSACRDADCERFIYREETLTYSAESYRDRQRGPEDCLGR